MFPEQTCRVVMEQKNKIKTHGHEQMTDLILGRKLVRFYTGVKKRISVCTWLTRKQFDWTTDILSPSHV